IEPWVGRLANTGTASADNDTFPTSHNVQAFLRALHLQLVLWPDRPAVRSDLLLVLVDALRVTNPHYLTVEYPDRHDRRLPLRPRRPARRRGRPRPWRG